MKTMLKIMLEIALGFAVFSFVCFILGLFAFFVVDFFENIPFIDIFVMSIIGLMFVIVCWSMGADLLKNIKSMFKKCD